MEILYMLLSVLESIWDILTISLGFLFHAAGLALSYYIAKDVFEDTPRWDSIWFKGFVTLIPYVVFYEYFIKSDMPPIVFIVFYGLGSYMLKRKYKKTSH